jgi:hypothetical protein
MAWNEMTRGQYIFWMISMFFIPFLAGFGAAVIQPWSDFWWNFTIKLFYVWCSWVLFSALLGWHNHRFSRLFPFIFVYNIASVVGLVPLWRVVEESVVLGWLLLLSHLLITMFTYIYSKDLMERNFSKISWVGRLWIGLVILLPILWIVVIVSLDLFTTRVMNPLGFAICSYLLNIPFVSLSIRFRDPDWNPKKVSL